MAEPEAFRIIDNSQFPIHNCQLLMAQPEAFRIIDN